MIDFIGFIVSLIENIQSGMLGGGVKLFQAMINNGFARAVFTGAVGFEFVWIFVEIILEDDLPGGVGVFVKSVLVASFCWIFIQPGNYDKIATAITKGSDVIVAQIGSVSPSGDQTPMQILASAIANGMQLKMNAPASANPSSPSAKAAAALPMPGQP